MQWRQMTLDVSRQNVSSALAAMLASTASIITLTGGELIPPKMSFIRGHSILSLVVMAVKYL